MQPLNILYIEDNPGDAALLCEQFKREDPARYCLTHSENLTGALKLLSQQDYNAILLDLNLPDGDGLNNIRALKDVKPHVPIVILTGANDEQKAEEALLKGAQEYIVKNHASCEIIKRILQSSILRQKAEIELIHKAHHDPLTGLPNRSSFEETATMLIKRAQRWNSKEALMFIDLNKFKEINDTLGHEAGNAVLVEVARRLKKTLRQSDLVARYAGDEFVVHLDSNRNLPITEELCVCVAEKVSKGVEKVFHYEGNEIMISLSIGVSIFPDAGENFESLLKAADKAMYHAKQDLHKSYYIIGDEDNCTALEKSTISYKDIEQTINTAECKHIIVVDDSEADQILFKKMLTDISPNYRVSVAKNTIKARQIIEKQKPDCVILDYNLSEKSGLDFLKEINDLAIDTAIIIATDQDNRMNAVEAMKYGAHDYLVKKEINKNALSRALQNAIDKNDLNRELSHYQDKLEQSNQELSEFAHTVAHDLKAPLRRIYTFCDMLAMQDDIQNEDTKHIVSRMSVNAMRLHSLIDGLLIYGQMMSDREEKTMTCLTTLINDVLEDLEIPLKEKNAAIRLEKLPNIPVYPLRMRQLFTNLIYNSLKYSQSDISPVIDVRREIKGDHCIISVADNGIGMCPDKAKKIFKPFYRLHSNDQIEGNGLGLSICQKVVQKHGGKIWAESDEGKGCVFNILLPLDMRGEIGLSSHTRVASL